MIDKTVEQTVLSMSILKHNLDKVLLALIRISLPIAKVIFTTMHLSID